MITSIMGYIATTILVISMCFNTNTYKGTILLRVFNMICCFFFITYGILLISDTGLEALPTVVSNTILVFVNIHFLIDVVKNRKNFKNKQD